jgi:hypothetical protein
MATDASKAFDSLGTSEGERLALIEGQPSFNEPHQVAVG